MVGTAQTRLRPPYALIIIVVVGWPRHRTIPPPRRTRLRLWNIIVRFEYRAAWCAELQNILPQTCHDAIFIRNLFTANPEYIGCTGDLLVKRPAMLLGKRRSLKQNNAADRQRKAEDNPVLSHAQSFIRFSWRAVAPRQPKSRNGYGFRRFTPDNKM